MISCEFVKTPMSAGDRHVVFARLAQLDIGILPSLARAATKLNLVVPLLSDHLAGRRAVFVGGFVNCRSSDVWCCDNTQYLTVRRSPHVNHDELVIHLVVIARSA